MKKINSQGFVLAETLVVAVFLTIIFAMIYSNFYPLIGEYEKRETYDDVDGKYSVYWLKRMIEDSEYTITSTKKINNFQNKGYIRFECSDYTVDTDKRETCKNLVKALEVDGCDNDGAHCEIYITKYRIGGANDSTWFKDTVKTNLKKQEENCSTGNCKTVYVNSCKTVTKTAEECGEEAEKKVFRTGFQDYIMALPDYTAESLNYAKYRVIASFHHTKDNNNYYSYATIEVNK